MTPPETSADSSPESSSALDSNQSINQISPIRQSDSLIKLAGRSMQIQLDNLEELSVSDNPTDPELDALSADSVQEISNKYLGYIDRATVVLRSIDSGDDVSYALQNREVLPVIESRVESLGANISKYTPAIDLWMTSQGTGETGLPGRPSWAEVRSRYESAKELAETVKVQVSIADDWQDCQESLDAIHTELKELVASVYLAEEQRHVALPAASIDLDVLATILEDPPEGENTGTPGKKVHDDGLSQWDRASAETITRLTSKLSPLKASISMFRPRLDSFIHRANIQFPSSVEEIRARYEKLNSGFTELVRSFQKLKKELAEDKWMAVFRQVNKQATEMMSSVQRSLTKLDSIPFNSIDAGRLIENFEMKSEHYGKAIPAVLSIMKKGVTNRLTVNGEILRGYDLLTQRWAQLSIDLADMYRRVQGARAAGIMRDMSDLLGKRTNRRNYGAPELGCTKSRTTRKASERSSPSRSYSPSPAVPSFRKDTSLDPPRSRSRLSNQSDRFHGGATDGRPPWNAGTVPRVSESTTSSTTTPQRATPSRSTARSTSRLAVYSSSNLLRPQTPSLDNDNRSSSSFLPLRTPRKASLGARSTSIPTVLESPSGASSQRLPKSKISSFSMPSSKLAPPSTPINHLRSSISRPKTPTSIPVSRRLVSNPESIPPNSALRKPRTSTLNNLHSSTSALPLKTIPSTGARRQSGIPLPSPHKSKFVT